MFHRGVFEKNDQGQIGVKYLGTRAITSIAFRESPPISKKFAFVSTRAAAVRLPKCLPASLLWRCVRCLPPLTVADLNLLCLVPCPLLARHCHLMFPFNFCQSLVVQLSVRSAR